MKSLYIVTYDIHNDKRLRKVFRLMKGYGDHIQYSVFRCELSDQDRAQLIMQLDDIIKPSEDQALFFPLGPAGGAREQQIHCVGLPYEMRSHGPTIV